MQKRLVSLSTSIIASGIRKNAIRNTGTQEKKTGPGSISLLPAFLIHSFNSLFYIRKINIRGHSGAQTIVVAGQTNLYAEHLFDPVRDGLHVARGKLCLSIYLLDNAVEIFARKRIDTDSTVLAEFA